ncbi:MAG: hypothetical protein Q9191_007815 [Dirinaria sp. TL-2023a]
MANATSALTRLTASVGMPISKTSSLQLNATSSLRTNTTSSIDYSECILDVGNVQVLYFPESTTSTNVTRPPDIVTAVEGNYTFTSPSVYVVWSTVSAVIEDWLRGPPTPLAAHYNITKAYPPKALMTVPGDCDYHGANGRPWAALNVNDLSNPSQNWIAAQGCFWQFGEDGGTGPLGGVDPNGTEMAASPIVSYPADIKTIDPKWKKCDADVYNWGAYDPPRALVPVHALTPEPAPAPAPAPAHHTSDASSHFAPPKSPTAPQSIESFGPMYHTSVATPMPKATMPADVPAAISVKKTAAPGPSHPARPGNHSPGIPPQAGGIQGGNPWSLGDPQADSAPSKGAKEPKATPVNVAIAANQPVYVLPDGAVSVAGTILKPGAPAITVANTRVSADAQSVYIGGSSIAKPRSPAVLDPPPSIIRGHRLKVTNKGEVILGDQVVSSGSQTTIDGISVSVGTDRLVIDSSTYAMPSTAASLGGKLPWDDLSIAERPAVWTPGDEIEAGPSGAIIIGSQTIPQGQSATIGGIYVSVAKGHLVLGTRTYSKPSITDPPSPLSQRYREISYDGEVLTVPILPAKSLQALLDPSASAESPTISTDSSGAIIVNGKTYSSGYQVTASGDAITVGSGIVVAAGKTYAFPTPTDSTISRAGDGAVIVDGHRLMAGAQTTISGTAVSVGGNILIVGGKTYALPLPTDSAVSRESNGAVVFDGHKLVPGTQTTISGTVISLVSDSLIVDGKTYALPLPTDPAVSLASNGAVVLDGVTLTQGEQTVVEGTSVSLEQGFVVVQGTTYALPTTSSGPLQGDPRPANPEGLESSVVSTFGYAPLADKTSIIADAPDLSPIAPASSKPDSQSSSASNRIAGTYICIYTALLILYLLGTT